METAIAHKEIIKYELNKAVMIVKHVTILSNYGYKYLGEQNEPA